MDVALLAAVAFLAERQSVAIGANTEMSISVLPILFAAVVFGPVAAMIVSACSLVGEFGRPYTRWIVWTSSRALDRSTGRIVVFLVWRGGLTPSVRCSCRCSCGRSASSRRHFAQWANSSHPTKRVGSGNSSGDREAYGEHVVAVHAGASGFGLCVPRAFAVDRSAVLRSRGCRAATLGSVSGAASTRHGVGYCKHPELRQRVFHLLAPW